MGEDGLHGEEILHGNDFYLLAFDAAPCRDVLAVFMRVVFGWLRRAAARHGLRDSQCAAVTVIPRFGSS